MVWGAIATGVSLLVYWHTHGIEVWRNPGTWLLLPYVVEFLLRLHMHIHVADWNTSTDVIPYWRQFLLFSNERTSELCTAVLLLIALFLSNTTLAWRLFFGSVVLVLSLLQIMYIGLSFEFFQPDSTELDKFIEVNRWLGRFTYFLLLAAVYNDFRHGLKRHWLHFFAISIWLFDGLTFKTLCALGYFHAFDLWGRING